MRERFLSTNQKPQPVPIRRRWPRSCSVTAVRTPEFTSRDAAHMNNFSPYLKITGRVAAERYNLVVSRLAAAIAAAILLLSSCGSSIDSKEKVQEAILERLKTHAGLDMNSLSMTTTAVRFDKNKAYATVAFHQKGDTDVHGGMVMTYTLEKQNGKWNVIGVGDSTGHGLQNSGQPSAPGGEHLPPGHPPLDSSQQMPQAVPQQGAGVPNQ